MELGERFWSKVKKTPYCWEWCGSTTHNGYGEFHWNKKTVRVHRLVYEAENGPIPKGMIIMHTCDNRRCVNPCHLVQWTPLENTVDMVEKGRCLLGSDNPSSKLNEAVVSEMLIRFALARGKRGTQRKLCNDYGVEQATVNAIVKRKSWKHVEAMPRRFWLERG